MGAGSGDANAMDDIGSILRAFNSRDVFASEWCARVDQWSADPSRVDPWPPRIHSWA